MNPPQIALLALFILLLVGAPFLWAWGWMRENRKRLNRFEALSVEEMSTIHPEILNEHSLKLHQFATAVHARDTTGKHRATTEAAQATAQKMREAMKRAAAAIYDAPREEKDA